MSREIRSRRIASRVSAVLLAAAAPALAVDKSFLVANGVWGTAGNWNPLGAPTVADNAHIGNTAGAVNGIVSVGAPANAANLFISDGMTLRTQLFTPTISSHTSILGFNAPGGDLFRSRLMVDDGSGVIDFQTNSLTVDDGGQVELAEGRMRVNGLFDLNTASLFSGIGTLDLHSNAAGPAMIVNGLITPVGDLRIHQNGTAPVDLDGTLEADRVIDVTGTLGMSYSSFVLRGTHLYDAFGDTFQIGRGNVVNLDLDSGWTLSPAGVINFQHQAGRTELAHLTGGTMTVNGDITVDADGGGLINTPAIVQSGAHISVGSSGSLTFNQPTTINGGVFDVANNAELEFTSPTTINGGTFNAAGPSGDVTLTGATTYSGNVTFSGIARQVGAATVASPTTIHGDTFDMDGGAGITQWTVNAPLTIDTDSIDFSGNLFNGTMTINSPNAFSPNYIDVTTQTTEWGVGLGGTMNLNGPGGGVVHANTVRGGSFFVHGTLNVNGGHSITSRMGVENTGTVNVNAGASLRLDGGDLANPNRMYGGRILGAGTLRAQADHALRGYGTIATAIDFDNNAELRASDSILSITGAIADVGVIGTANSTGILNVTNPWNTAVAERVELLGGLVNGAQITNDGQITGHGSVIATGIINNGSISAVGGELLVNSAGGQPLDLDGAGTSGRIHSVQGDLTIVDQPGDSFGGQAFVGAGRTLRLENGWFVASTGSLSLTGTPANPATVAGNAQVLDGDVVVSGSARFDINTLFMGPSTVTTSGASDSLTLVQHGQVYAGATFSGPGTLRVASTGSLTMVEGATVGMPVNNDGGLVRISTALNTGIASVQQFTQSSQGTTRAKLGGIVPGNDFDRLNVAEGAQLAGALELSDLNGYVPAFLQSHEILRADSVTGFFGTVPNNKIAADKYWAVTYDADSVFATAALPGDSNLDGSVNITDFAIMASQFNTHGPWAEGNFNGDTRIDINDFALLAAYFNVSVPADLPRGGAVPEPAALGALLPIAAMAQRRRRRVA